MTSVQFRAIKGEDLSPLYLLWYDKAVLEQPSSKPIPKDAWLLQRQRDLEHPHYYTMMAQDATRHLGYVWGHLATTNAPLYGVMDGLVIDLHLTNAQNQVANLLVNPFIVWLKAQGAQELQVHHVRLAVEQAFWRGIGAIKESSTYILRLG